LGSSHFDPPRKPRVQIARTLFENGRRVHRLRFTLSIHALAHEYARVVILAPLYLRAGFTRRDEHPYTDTEIDASVTQWTGWSGKPATRLARS